MGLGLGLEGVRGRLEGGPCLRERGGEPSALDLGILQHIYIYISCNIYICISCPRPRHPATWPGLGSVLGLGLVWGWGWGCCWGWVWGSGWGWGRG